jgi:hypothetical protein
MRSVFISYAREDTPAAEVVTHRLKAAGVDVFLDRMGLVSGESWSARLRVELDSAGAVLVLLSSSSQRSKWVEEEVQAAIERKKTVIPVLLDPGGKENWVWPLVGTRQAFPLQLGSAHESSQVRAIVEAVFSSDSPDSSPMPSDPEHTPAEAVRAHSIWRSVLLAALSAAIGVLATLYWLR